MVTTDSPRSTNNFRLAQSTVFAQTSQIPRVTPSVVILIRISSTDSPHYRYRDLSYNVCHGLVSRTENSFLPVNPYQFTESLGLTTQRRDNRCFNFRALLALDTT